MANSLTRDQQQRVDRAREVLKASNEDTGMGAARGAYQLGAARLAYQLGACSWWLEDILAVVAELTGAAS